MRIRNRLATLMAAALLALATAAQAQFGYLSATGPVRPIGGFFGAFGQPITPMGNPYQQFFGTGPLGNLSGATGPLATGQQVIGPLSGVMSGQQLLAPPLQGKSAFEPPLGGQNLLSDQPVFNGQGSATPTVPTVNSPLVLSAGGPGYGYTPVAGYYVDGNGNPYYVDGNGNAYYPQQYSGGVPGMAGGATVNAAQAGNVPIARASDWIDAKLIGSNRIQVTWRGDPQAVSRVTVALLDKNRAPIVQQATTRVPVQVTLSLTSRTAYYQVLVQYVNGTTTSVIAPL